MRARSRDGPIGDEHDVIADQSGNGIPADQWKERSSNTFGLYNHRQRARESTMNAYTVVTGGALGADTLAEELARFHGMTVNLKLCPHQPQVSEHTPHLSRREVEDAQPHVKTAAEQLGRQPSKNPFVRDLFARNHYIAKEASALYAYAEFEQDALVTVKGGSGMTVQMVVDHNRGHGHKWKNVFVFDEGRDKWYELERVCDYEEDFEVVWTDALGDYRFMECVSAPLLHFNSAVVGSRTLGSVGQRTMRRQFAQTVKEHVRYEELRAWRQDRS